MKKENYARTGHSRLAGERKSAEKVALSGGTLLSPLPVVLVSCGSLEKPNLITVAWTGIVNTKPPMTYISVRPERFSHALIREGGEFVINLVDETMVRATDFCGVRSGRDVDKFAAFGFEPFACEELSCPGLKQSPLSLACRVRQIIPLGSHDMFLAEILRTYADSSLLDRSGKLRLDRAGLVSYSHGEYYSLGKKLGSFGYSVRRKK
jgi:hypothetical protein ELI_2267